MDDIKKQTLQLEVKKHAMRQAQTGEWVVSFVVHPHDMPIDLMAAPMGQHYMMVLAAIAADGTIEPPREKTMQERALAMAGTLCKNTEFWAYMRDFHGYVGYNEQDYAEALRAYLDVKSRREILTSERAYQRFMILVADFAKFHGMKVEDFMT